MTPEKALGKRPNKFHKPHPGSWHILLFRIQSAICSEQDVDIGLDVQMEASRFPKRNTTNLCMLSILKLNTLKYQKEKSVFGDFPKKYLRVTTSVHLDQWPGKSQLTAAATRENLSRSRPMAHHVQGCNA